MIAPTVNGRTRSASKRSRSPGNHESPLSASPAPKAPKQDDAGLPAFLRQSKAEIHKKFDDLEWQQQIRMAQGRNDPSSPWVQDQSPQVKARNRYLNVLPWAKSRVHLKVPEGCNDYINASPISLPNPLKGPDAKYIVTQGPKKELLGHFWKMIWDETTDQAVIVMLTQVSEQGREKCYQYFPLDDKAGTSQLEIDDEEHPNRKGTIKFLESNYDEASKSTMRKLLLTFGEEKKTIWHMLFCGWPDFLVPADADKAALIQLIKHSAAQSKKIPKNPRIIHCSAGVGRSGTFIALENLLAQLESGAIAKAKDSEDLIFETVHRLREQRMMMVQGDAQYQFLYDVLREQFLHATTGTHGHHHSNNNIKGEPSPKAQRLTIHGGASGGGGVSGSVMALNQGKAPRP